MLFLSVCATFVAVIWTIIVFMANGMADTVNGEYVGGPSTAMVWLFVAVLWCGWYLG